MSAVEKQDPSGKPAGRSAGASPSGSDGESEVTPLPAPMPGLSMELDALEPEEPSLAPLAKLPGVVARAGASGKKLKAEISPGGKSSSGGKSGAKGKPKTTESDRAVRKTDSKADATTDGKSKPAAPLKQSLIPASAAAAAQVPATTLPPLPTPPLVVPVVAERDAALSPVGSPTPPQRSRAWWAIGALGLVALGAGAGALLWQPAAPTNPVVEPTAPPAALPPRTELTVQPIAPLPSGAGQPTPVVEALPPPTPPAGKPVESGAPSSASSPTAKAAGKPVADPGLQAAHTASKPAATGPGSHSVGTPGNKPAAETKPQVAKVPTKATAKPAAAVASAPLSMDPVPQLSPPIIRQHMLAAEKRFPGCVREGFGSNVSIGIVVESNGNVRKADILGSLGQSGTGRCISDQLRSLHFPPFTEGGATKFFVWSYQIPQAN